MKPIIVAVALWSSLSAAAVEEKQQLAVTVQPIPWLFGTYGGSVDYVLSEKLTFSGGANVQAVMFGLSQTPSGSSAAQTNSVSLFGIGVQPGVSYFLKGRAPEGLWVGPKLELGYVAATSAASSGDTGFSSTASSLNFGLQGMAGYNVVFDNGFVIQLGLGLGFNFASVGLSSSFRPPPLTPPTPAPPVSVVALFSRASLGVGWVF